ncbi:PadR family transcriptional regulator [Natrinema caseinilyticum]|uniref:PadR family transcriptional regulator n=1 Tax=Natrinema caseinilyticum TaxID=2961570 RepID=UPI0020C407D6|nr:helix-turn-helix transcriptional regulator [Natrinema caseinilyticum]
MSLIGSTKMDILRLLYDSPQHGYQIHKELDITTSTVYRHLNELEDAGMVVEKGDTENNRIEYALTDDGEELLKLLSD